MLYATSIRPRPLPQNEGLVGTVETLIPTSSRCKESKKLNGSSVVPFPEDPSGATGRKITLITTGCHFFRNT